MLSFHLFGPPEILRDGAPLSITRRKSRALLFYLAAQPGHTTREALLTLLWPDLARPAAQQSLRTTLHGLRQALGDALQIEGERLALAAWVESDVRLLEAALEAALPDPARLAAALAGSQGEFLAGFSLSDAPDFDEWINSTRERLRRQVVRGLSLLAEGQAQAGQVGLALETIERALVLEPLLEDLHRNAMRLHYRNGDRVGAIRRYEQLRTLLDDELGVPPVAETRALYDAIVTDAYEPPAQPAALVARRSTPPTERWQPPLAGRAAELHRLGELLGTGQFVLLEGEPGIGKTRLAEEFANGFAGLTLAGIGRELDHGLPYQPLIDALRGLLARPDWPNLRARLALPGVWTVEVARLLPEFAGATFAAAGTAGWAAGRADESRLREGISQFLRALAQVRPVLLFIDDLQWADAATLGLLGYLASRALPQVALLAAAQPDTPRSLLAALLQALTREGRLTRMGLKRLSPADTATLAGQVSPRARAALAEWLVHQGEGNPYIIAELLRDARARGILQPDGTLDLAGLSASPVVPASIYSLIQSRLARLSEPARRVLDVAVAAGRIFEGAVAARAAALADEQALDAFDELRAAGLIVVLDAGRYRFDHSLTMEVAYREVGEPRHRLLHRRLGEALEHVYQRDLDAVAGAIAAHFFEGEAPGRAVPYALRAARQAAALAAWDEAIAWYEQVLTTNVEPPTETLAALGEAYFYAGNHARATEVMRAALVRFEAAGNRSGALGARLALMQALMQQARFSEMIAEANVLISSGEPQAVLQGELMWGAILSIEGADLVGAAQHLERAAALASSATPAATRAQISFERGSVLAQLGDLHAAVASYQQALAAAQEDDAAFSFQVLANNNIAYHLLLLGDPAAGEYARRGLAQAQERGQIGLQPFLLSTNGEIALAAGDLAAANSWFEEGLALAERLEVPERIAGLTANLGRVAAAAGQTATAIHRFSTALAQADSLGTCHLAAQIRIWLTPLLPPAEARAILAEARAIAERGGRRRLLEEIERLA